MLQDLSPKPTLRSPVLSLNWIMVHLSFLSLCPRHEVPEAGPCHHTAACRQHWDHCQEEMHSWALVSLSLSYVLVFSWRHILINVCELPTCPNHRLIYDLHLKRKFNYHAWRTHSRWQQKTSVSVKPCERQCWWKSKVVELFHHHKLFFNKIKQRSTLFESVDFSLFVGCNLLQCQLSLAEF